VPYPLAADELRFWVREASSKRTQTRISGTCSLKRVEARLSVLIFSSKACCKLPKSVQLFALDIVYA